MKRLVLLALVSGLVLPTDSRAETPEEKGLRIATAAYERGRGFGSVESVGEMTLRDRQGVQSVRRFRTRLLEMASDGNRSMIVFELPRDISGTAVLTHSHKNRADDQWLYLPALKRVKRISSGGKTSSFAGSEFSYEDLAAPSLERFTYKWLRDEPCPGRSGLSCHVLERYPRDKTSGYARQVVWLDQAHYRVLRTDFYDRKNALLKTLVAGNFKQYEGRYWLVGTATMTNLRTGKSTVMTWSQRDFSVDLTENDLSQRALRWIK